MPLVYDKLDPAKFEFRVLDIHPGDAEEMLQSTLRTVSFDAAPVYDAVSYVWGDPDDTVSMEVDGHSFSATVSLHGILHVLRNQHENVTVWADAICINQRDEGGEKMAQVGIMASIYREATHVHIWYGEMPTDWLQEMIRSDSYATVEFAEGIFNSNREGIEEMLCMKFGRAISPDMLARMHFPQSEHPIQHAIRIIAAISAGLDIFSLPFVEIEREKVTLATLFSPENDSRNDGDGSNDPFVAWFSPDWYAAAGALIWLIRRPWVTRCWTFQEAVVPNRVPIGHVGHFSFPLRELHLTCFCLEVNNRKVINDQGRTLWAKWWTNLWCGSVPHDGLQLYNLVNITTRDLKTEKRNLRVTDVLLSSLNRKTRFLHDKLYSVIGLFIKSTIEADYTISHKALCSRAMKVLLALDSVLDQWPTFAVGVGVDQCPSWALDLQSDVLCPNDCVYGHYSAAGKMELTSKDLLTQIYQPYFQLESIHIAAIEAWSPPTNKGLLPKFSAVSLAGLFETWQNFASAHGIRGTSAQVWRALLPEQFASKAIVRGETGDFPLQPSRLQTFSQWWETYHDKYTVLVDWIYGTATLHFDCDGGRCQAEAHYSGHEASSLLSLVDLTEMISSMVVNITTRRLLLTEKGDLGVGRPTLEIGDEIHIVKGVAYPVVARKSDARIAQSQSCYQFVSECYLDGWMYGETINDETPWKEIIFV